MSAKEWQGNDQTEPQAIVTIRFNELLVQLGIEDQAWEAQDDTDAADREGLQRVEALGYGRWEAQDDTEAADREGLQRVEALGYGSSW